MEGGYAVHSAVQFEVMPGTPEWPQSGSPVARSTKPSTTRRVQLASERDDLQRRAIMSVIVILRIPGNPSDLERYAAGPGGEVMQRIAEAGKAAGAVRHS